jgi:uncharacterized protein YxeA
MSSFKKTLHKLLILSLTILYLGLSDIQAQTINGVIEKYELTPQMISYHPNGEWIMSSSSEGNNPYLLIRIDDVKTTEAEIDTLDYGYYLNISKLSNDGDELLYGFLDTLKSERKTYLRTYEDGTFSEPVDFRKKTGLNALTYFMIDEPGNVYFYTYDLDPKGIYKLEKTADGYGEPALLISNRPNYVAFSPLLIDETTLLLAQHGQDDNSVNGIYVSKKENSRWSTPVKLEGLPYGWSLGFGEEDSVIYLIAETRKVKMIPLPELEERIDKVLSQ